MSDKTTEIEIQLSHLQRLYEQLNDVVTSQSLELDRLQRRVITLETKLKELGSAASTPAEDPMDEKPPHY